MSVYRQGVSAGNFVHIYHVRHGPVFGDEQWWVRGMVSPGAVINDRGDEDPNAWGRAGGRFGAALAPAAGVVGAGYPGRGCAQEFPSCTVLPWRGQLRVFGTSNLVFEDGFE